MGKDSFICWSLGEVVCPWPYRQVQPAPQTFRSLWSKVESILITDGIFSGKFWSQAELFPPPPQLVLESGPCLLEHKVTHLFRCGSEMHRSKGDSLHLCDRKCYSSNTIESKGGSPLTSTLVSTFLSIARSSALYYKSSTGGSLCQLQKGTVSKNKLQLQLVLAPHRSCTAM